MGERIYFGLGPQERRAESTVLPVIGQAGFCFKENLQDGTFGFWRKVLKLGADVLAAENFVEPLIKMLPHHAGQSIELFGIDEIAARITRQVFIPKRIALSLFMFTPGSR